MKKVVISIAVLLVSLGIAYASSFTDDCIPNAVVSANQVITNPIPIDAPDAITWTTLTPSTAQARYWCPGSGVYRDTIWFCGGRGLSPNISLNDIVAYIPATNTWVTTGLPTLLTTRRAGGGGRIGNKIYVAGGRDNSSVTLATCEEFDVDTKLVTAKASMPTVRWACASAVAGGKLYIIGKEATVDGVTYEYDPVANSWATKTPCPVARGWAAAAGANGKVYVFGGFNGSVVLGDCYEFDPVANTWTAKAAMPTVLVYQTAVTVNDQDIYLVGGSIDNTNPTNVVYKYNIASNTWTTETPMPTARGWEMVNYVGSAIYATFGCDNFATATCLTTNERGSLAPPPTNDVGVTAILSPGPLHPPNALMTPQGRIRNHGTATQTNFAVVCSIVNMTGTVRHWNTQTISLAGQRDTTVTFTSWTPTVIESLNVIMKTNLINDTNPANDRRTQITYVTDAVQIIIGTGTTNTYLYPMHCGQAYSVAEDIYLQSEIGYYGRIMNLAYSKASGTALNPIESVAIFMKHTTEETLATGPWDTTGYTRVYAGPFPNTATTGWMEITLNTPFLYNNVDNLKILILKGPPSFTSYPYWHYTTTTPAYRNRYGYGATPPTSLTRTVVRPNIRFSLIQGPRPARDVGVRAILSPSAWQFPNTLMTPQARVMNYGSASQTFPVVCSIINMSGATRHVNTQTISLASLAETTVTFTSWTPTILETLNIIMKTNLTNDTNPSNDRMTRTTRITNVAEIIIGTGTSGSAYYLMYCGQVYSVSEAIYLQPEIGYYGNITNLAYYKTAGTALTPVETVSFYMRHTTEATVATGAWDTTGYTLVYTGSFPNSTTTGWMDVTLDTPFLFNNQDNLQILVFKCPPSFTGYPSYQYTTTSPAYRNRYAYGATPPASITQTYYRPNVRLSLSPGIPGVEEKPTISPIITSLNVTKPNPVNGLARISFTLAEPTKANLSIYDASGRLIKTLVNSHLDQGIYTYNWNGTDNNNRAVAEGIYFYTLETPKQNSSKKMVFTR